jgi:serine protease
VGTSFSAPLVSGTVALMLSARPSLTAGEIISTLKGTARPFPTTGADNGTDPTPVTACHAPDGTDQLQCYCSTGLCGAGMLDAAAAVAAVLPLVQARMDVLTATPQAGSAVQLSAAASQLGAGRTAASYLWEMTAPGAGVTAFSTAVNAATAAFLPTAAGTVGLRVTVTDDLGNKGSAELNVAVAAAPVVPPVTPPSSGGGGGAMSGAWLALLALGVVALRWAMRRGKGC